MYSLTFKDRTSILTYLSRATHIHRISNIKVKQNSQHRKVDDVLQVQQITINTG